MPFEQVRIYWLVVSKSCMADQDQSSLDIVCTPLGWIYRQPSLEETPLPMEGVSTDPNTEIHSDYTRFWLLSFKNKTIYEQLQQSRSWSRGSLARNE